MFTLKALGIHHPIIVRSGHRRRHGCIVAQTSRDGHSISRQDIETRIEASVKCAKTVCSQTGVSFACMWAWEEVDDLLKQYYEWNAAHPFDSTESSSMIKELETDIDLMK